MRSERQPVPKWLKLEYKRDCTLTLKYRKEKMKEITCIEPILYNKIIMYQFEIYHKYFIFPGGLYVRFLFSSPLWSQGKMSQFNNNSGRGFEWTTKCRWKGSKFNFLKKDVNFVSIAATCICEDNFEGDPFERCYPKVAPEAPDCDCRRLIFSTHNPLAATKHANRWFHTQHLAVI